MLEAAIQQAHNRSAYKQQPVLGLFCEYNDPSMFEHLFDPQVKMMKVTCVSRITVSYLLEAFKLGAIGIFILICADDKCIYHDTTHGFELKIIQARKQLVKAGLDEDQLQLFKLTPVVILALFEWLVGLSEIKGQNPATA